MRAQGLAGFTLIELTIAIVMSTVILGAVFRILQNNQRFYRSQSQIVDVQSNVRSVAQILPAELREVDATDGDLIQKTDTAVTFKAMRGFGITCKVTDPANGYIYLRQSLIFGYRGVDATKDSALVWRDGDPTQTADDRWLHLGVSSVSTGQTCTDGSAATRLTLSGTISKLDSVWSGAAIRTFELVNYRLYADSRSVWWLGVRTYVSGSWSSTSPLAGPLQPNNGITFSYYDNTGAVTTDSSKVARIQVVVRGKSAQPILVPGRAATNAYYSDSLTVSAAMRNN